MTSEIEEDDEMEPRVINSSDDYANTVSEVSRLVALDPTPGSPEAERLELLALLVSVYEESNTNFQLPDPIDAIRFRMREQDLRQRDLVPYIGSASKVSEVLSRKRPLTISMIRALNKGLGISYEVLLQESQDPVKFDCKDFPVKEMVARSWIDKEALNDTGSCRQLIGEFFTRASGMQAADVFYRRTIFERVRRELNRSALLAWVARLLYKAQEENLEATFKSEIVDESFLNTVARLSSSSNGPIVAKEFLAQYGIALVIEPQLKGMNVDGASTISSNGHAVIGLTLRYDRLDNFWFTLLHELAHISKHLRKAGETFVDDLEIDYDEDPREAEADRMAKDAFIPRQKWARSSAFRQRTSDTVIALANEMDIHPAIVAGRLRRETKNYKIFSQLVGNGAVRCLFPEASDTAED